MHNNNIIKDVIDTEEKNSKLIIIMNICIILFLILLIRYFNGPIQLKTTHDSLAYEISLGDNKIDKFKVDEKYQKMIIPYFVYYSDKTSKEYNLNTNTFFAKSKKYNLNLNIYSCKKNNQEVSCLTTEDNNNKTKLKYNSNKYKLYIKYQNQNKYLYQGKLKKDITKYLSKSGYYSIVGKSNNITSDISFVINIF
jgi:hypothetical protein